MPLFKGVKTTPYFLPIEGALDMEKELIKFLNGEVNAVRLDVTIVREVITDDIDRLVVRSVDDEHKDYVISESFIKKKRKSNNPKHAGGKHPYIMLMVNEVEKLREQGIKNVEELIGYLVCLGKYIEWNTGRLVKKRSKKPLQYKDLQKTFPCGNKKLNRILGELKDNDLLFGTQEGYFISPRLIKRGKMKQQGDQ